MYLFNKIQIYWSLRNAQLMILNENPSWMWSSRNVVLSTLHGSRLSFQDSPNSLITSFTIFSESIPIISTITVLCNATLEINASKNFLVFPDLCHNTNMYICRKYTHFKFLWLNLFWVSRYLVASWNVCHTNYLSNK